MLDTLDSFLKVSIGEGMNQEMEFGTDTRLHGSLVWLGSSRFGILRSRVGAFRFRSGIDQAFPFFDQTGIHAREDGAEIPHEVRVSGRFRKSVLCTWLR